MRVRVRVRAPLGLDADDADRRVEGLDGKSDPRNQPGAADGHHDRVEVGHLEGYGWG